MILEAHESCIQTHMEQCYNNNLCENVQGTKVQLQASLSSRE